MLESLQIRNVALIDELHIEFVSGLNILTGETGAGKSIIIDSIHFLLGERPGKDFIRSGRTDAEVSGIFHIRHDQGIQVLQNMGIEVGEDRQLMLWRSVNASGRGSCRANGRIVTIGMLKELSGMLMDIHGQHQHHSLLDPAKHMELLDRFCGDQLEDEKRKLDKTVRHYRDILHQIREISAREADRQARVTLLQYQVDEIGAAGLKPGEDEALLERKNILSEGEKIAESALGALFLLQGGGMGEEKSVLSIIAGIREHIKKLGELDPSRRSLGDEIGEIEIRLTEIARELSLYEEGFEFDPEELNRVETRLDEIYRLKQKYGGSIESILAQYEKSSQTLSQLTDSEERLKALQIEKKQCGQQAVAQCETLSAIRKAAAEEIQQQIEDTLRDLGMQSARFAIQIERKKEFNADGYDRVEFLISPNAGEPLKPLARIASGGEMSRVMLAMKAILADADQMDTFIFDEIDTGISGRTAQQVAEKMAMIGRNHQILCITHLPQIASMGDRHFLIEKHTKEEHTFTTIEQLDSERTILELARLTGGAKITESTRKAAAEMKLLAEQLKLSGMEQRK